MNAQEIQSLAGEELKEKAKELGIKLTGNPSEDTIRKRIRETLGIADNADQDGKPPQQSAKKNSDSKKEYLIQIATDKENKQAVPVGVNGKVYRIKRGVKVKVPAAVVEVLNNAVQTHYEEDENGDLQPIESFSYQFTVFGEA